MITVTRVFDAPREMVFKAWTDPDHVAAWFGPAGFVTPRDSVDIELRVGGRFDLSMVRDGAERRLHYEIVELVEPELLVLKSDATVTRVELEDDGGRTRMTLTDGPYPEDVGRGAGAGWESAFDKLATQLAG